VADRAYNKDMSNHLNFSTLPATLTALAAEEDLTLVETSRAYNGDAIVREDGAGLCFIITPDYPIAPITFYYTNADGRRNHRAFRDLDKALSAGLDFIYG
jgi:hypothetical protein